jgi:hypothetical protein
MFSAYILEVNVKNFILFNLLYLHFCFRPHIFAGNSSLKACGVVPLLGIVRDITLLHTHTHTSYFFNTSLTNNFSLHTWPILKNFLFIRGTWRDQTAGRLTTGCWAVRSRYDTPGSSWKPPSPSYNIARCPCFFDLAVPYQLDNGFGDRNPALLRTHIADCSLRNDYSVRLIIIITHLEQVVMQCNDHIISVILWLHYLQTSLFLYINLHIYNQVEFANKASRFQYKLWEKRDITGPPVITYIYLCGQSYASCLSFFQHVLL